VPSLLTVSEGSRWADLVFHVLAHVEATQALAASLWDRTYVAFVERHLGPAAHRALGEDARVLGSLFSAVRSGASLGEREREHAAVVLLAERASGAGLGEPHRRWLGHFGKNAPDVRPASLGAEAERIVRAALDGR
jgi:hypothetical protein